ncbi:MAG: class I mannose-6-phosphate isomerase [Oscillospiraceae bacterium]|nr:class I mannose-6-phosphate isomerase [Oscillospiraceae bacterium]
MVKLKPACKDYLWGGESLKKLYHKDTPLAPLAECWELSTHPDGPCTVASGRFSGMPFPQYLKKLGRAALGENCARFSQFPVLIKFIDAQKPLSIQVHPDDAYAQSHEGGYGKTEMWYVLDCDPGAFLYYGVERAVTRQELQDAIQNDTVCDLLRRVPVKKGDVFFIPAGTLHAIGAGIRICEIQQNSNLTYRVYDYGRADKDGNLRPLHIRQALEVAALQPSPAYLESTADKPENTSAQELAQCEYFKTVLYSVADECTLSVTSESFLSLTFVEGSGVIENQNDALFFSAGDSLFLPADSGSATLRGHFQCIAVTVP